MKILVVYWSLDGNAKWVAEHIAAELGADLLKLETQEPFNAKGAMKYLVGGSQVIRKVQPDLQSLAFQPADYDLVILGTPVWAGSFVPAFLSFVTKYGFKGKLLGLYCCHGGGGEGKTFVNFEKYLPGNTVLGTLSLLDPYAKRANTSKDEILEWANQLKVKAEDAMNQSHADLL